MASLCCYRCGASLAALSLPLMRLDECPACTVSLHCCRMCEFFDPGVARQCREDDANDVKDKFNANFCDYFTPGADRYDPSFTAAESQSRSQLDALFGDGGPDEPDAATDDAEDLFRG